MRTLEERFEAKFIPEPMSGCWLWVGKIKKCGTGYGMISVDGRPKYAHRVSWELYHGDIGNAHVLHKCDNSFCVNPDHLYLGDQAQNNKDRDRRGRFVVLRGQDNGMARLTEGHIRHIRAITLSSIKTAPLFGVDASTIRKIRRRSIWAHIE